VAALIAASLVGAGLVIFVMGRRAASA